MKTLLALLALGLASPAFAGDCEIPDSQTIRASGGSVTIGQKMFPVRGKDARMLFVSKLHNCGMPTAARRFEQWRGSRRAVNWELGLGMFVAWPALVGIPVSGVNAKVRKAQLVESLRSRQ